MTKQEVRSRIREVGIVPVVRAASPEMALAAVDSVCAGGVPVVEITMTVPGAIDVIRELASSGRRDVLIGAGTVLDAAAAEKCIEAGAQFLVSPGFDAGMVAACKQADKLVIAGALTPTELMAAWRAGADIIKIFPCGNVGGAKYIKALKGPFPDVPMVPTGGVNLDTAADFLAAGVEALGIGGELVRADALKTGRVDIIIENARSFAAIVAKHRTAVSVERR